MRATSGDRGPRVGRRRAALALSAALSIGVAWGLAGAGARAAEPAADAAAETASAPATTIVLTPARASLKLGVDKEVEISIDLAGPDADRFTPVRALATVGTLEPLQAGVSGHFTARYLPPDDRFPQVALLVVEMANDAARVHGVTRIALQGSTLFPFHTNGGAAVTMKVAGRLFGPVVADHQGHVEIPIEVPPGVRKAEARAVDRIGTSRETEVDLQLPPFARVILLAPAAIEAGTFAEVTVVALDDDGAPTAAQQLTLESSAGLAHPLGGGPPGEARFLFEAPTRVGSGAVTLDAVAAGAVAAHATVVVPVHAGTARRLGIVTTNPHLVVGDPRPVQLSITARDRFGNPLSAANVYVRLDGRPSPVTVTPAGIATIAVLPPARYDGRDGLVVEATLGEVSSTQTLHITGGAPVRLTLQVAAPRVVADGKRGIGLRAQVVDANGTPTSVSGLSWDTPDGRIREVRVPRDGEYLAEYVPDRTREPRSETVAVMASGSLRASASVEATPPPVRLMAGVRTGLFTNFGRSTGPAAFIEGLTPVRVKRYWFSAGFMAGYLRGDVTGTGIARSGTSRLETNLFPLLAVGRWRLALPHALELGLEANAGWSWGWVRLTTNPNGVAAIDSAAVNALALGAGGELTYPLRPGRLAIGVRYLRIDLGQTSRGDELDGNSAGLCADLGYKMTF